MSDDVPRETHNDTEFVWSRLSHLWVCQTCGGYVANTALHGRWHNTLGRPS